MEVLYSFYRACTKLSAVNKIRFICEGSQKYSLDPHFYPHNLSSDKIKVSVGIFLFVRHVFLLIFFHCSDIKCMTIA